MVWTIMDINNFIQPIANMVTDIFGNPMLIGATVFLYLSFIAMVLFIPFEAMVAIWIPLSFLVMYWIPSLRIVVGLLLGILIGLGLIKWIRR